MAHTRSWDNTSPANSDAANLGAQEIRQFKEDTDERMQIDHVWGDSINTDGRHAALSMVEQSSHPTGSANLGKFYGYDDGSDTELYYRNSSNKGGKLTENGYSNGVPVGSIVGFLPGYFADGSNGTYTDVGLTLPDNWVLCDGAAPNDSDSPIWNSASRYVPYLQDSRFLMGSNAATRGVIGGSTTMNHTHTTPGHYHSAGTLTTGIGGSHSHAMFNEFGGTNVIIAENFATWSNNPGDDNAYAIWGNNNTPTVGITSSDTHTHTISGSAGNTGGSNGDSAITSSNASFVENKPLYLAVTFIIRIK
jgi:hypothetical protein